MESEESLSEEPSLLLPPPDAEPTLGLRSRLASLLISCCGGVPGEPSAEKRASKVVRLHSAAVNSLVTEGPYLVSGGAEGHIRFFDFDFRIIAWFEDLDAGPVSSVSFAHQPHTLKTPGEDGAAFSCPDFVVSTHNARLPPSNPARAARARCGAVHAPVPC